MSEGMTIQEQIHLQQMHDLGRAKLRKLTNEIIQQDKELQALRDERDRLREALVKCRRELWHCNEQLKYKGATEGFSVTEALSEAKAALTPAGGGQDGTLTTDSKA